MMNQDPIPTSRWLEMELHWFDPEDLESHVDRFVERLTPLWRSVSGDKALLWSTGLGFGVLEAWTGDLDAPIGLDRPSYAAWRDQPFRRLAELVALLRRRAEAAGLGRLRVGFMFTPGLAGGGGGMAEVGDALYEGASPRLGASHPEASMRGDGTGPIDPLAVLEPDDRSWGGFPDGVPEGTTVADFFGGQWGSLSRMLDLDAVVLRDGFLGPMLYCRRGPFGVALASDAEAIDLWTRRAITIFRAVKDANPDVRVAGYTSAVGGVADWRVGCSDIERIVADGAIDILIDQTWGGAWQDFWHDTMIGWTFQQANLLSHRAQVAGGNAQRRTPCQHFFLTETWDAWEPWDTLHQVPGKLAWSMWAFSHATLMTGEGPKRADGVYLSWMNNRFGELIPEPDVRWLGDHLDAAQRDAAAMTRPLGPTGVYHRRAMEAAIAEDASDNVTDFLDDQIGMLNKYGFGCLSITRVEDVDGVDADGLLWQTPDRASDVPSRSRGPQMYAGRADRIDPALIERAGAAPTGRTLPAGYDSLIALEGRSLIRPLYTAAFQPVDAEQGRAIAELRRGPMLTQSADRQHLYWMPQDWWQPGLGTVRGSHLGTLSVYPAVVRAFQRGLEAHQGRWWIDAPEEAQPICVHLWQVGASVRVLAGNLETSAFGDARTPRSVGLLVRPEALDMDPGSLTLTLIKAEAGQPDAPPPASIPGVAEHIAGADAVRFAIELGPEAFAVYELSPRPGD